MKKTLLYFYFSLFTGLAFSQYSKTITVFARATANATSITLDWPAETFSGSFKVYKRTDINQSWNLAATLLSTATSWTDTSIKVGISREFLIQKANPSNQSLAEGYLFVGNKAKEIPSFGSVLLLIDSNYRLPLATEINQLKNDLSANGWLVTISYAGRYEKASTIKARIISMNALAKPAFRSLYIIGHVRVPYSGMLRNIDSAYACAYPPDGHIEGSGNHTGAWPADLYYGDLTGIYSDMLGPVKTGSDSRNWNVAGDGKFDQCKVLDNVTIEVGRVDLYNMPQFSKNDTLLVKNYLQKARDWRQDKVAVVERSIIDDNLTGNGFSLGWTGYLSSTSMIPRDSIFNNRDYFTYQNKESYLWSFGVGYGSYQSCAGIGVTSSFTPSFKNIFTSMSGSFFGDWDNQNNILRAPLAVGSLCSFWGGIPTWYNHYMGLGYPIGFGALYTQNSKNQDFNGSENSVHIALMGDPTLKVRNVPETGKLKVASVNNKVKLSWGKALGKFDGYCVYRIDTATNTWLRINTTILTDTFYVDAANVKTGSYKYAVRTIRLETNPSGSWYNLGGGAFAWINYNVSLANLAPINFAIFPNPSSGLLTISSNEFNNETITIAVNDLTGRMVFETRKPASNGEIQIELPQYLNGTFLVHCHLNGRIGATKVIVTH